MVVVVAGRVVVVAGRVVVVGAGAADGGDVVGAGSASTSATTTGSAPGSTRNSGQPSTDEHAAATRNRERREMRRTDDRIGKPRGSGGSCR